MSSTAQAVPPPAPARARRRALPAGPLVAGVLAFALHAWLGLARWNAGRSGAFDLGVFAQAAQSWAAGNLPYSDIRGLPLLGEHFSPVTALFGAAWWLWPDPRSLILTQAAAVAVGAAVVHATARRHLDARAAAVVTLVFTTSYGLVGLTRLDVHEVCFAVPLLALSCSALADRRLTAAMAWALPLLLVKEDQGPTVAAVAAVAFLLARGPGRGRVRRRAVAAVLLALAGTALAFAAIRYGNPDGEVPLFTLRFAGEAAAAEPWTWAADGAPRALLVLTVLAAGGFVWVRSPLALVALPTLAWRLASPYESYWSTGFHYDAVLMPVVALALVDVLRRTTRRPGRVPVLLLAAVAVVALTTSAVTYRAANYVASPLDPGAWRPSAAAQDLLALSADLPAGSLVAADNGAGPYLVARHTVRLLSNLDPVRAEWVVVDTRIDGASASSAAKTDLLAEARALGLPVVQHGTAAAVRMPCAGTVWLPEPGGNPPLPAPVWRTGC
ncbi:DUF2079 domain-containing protein [Kineococcus arenarius]|uniref:DUF2079 domain-containing protein n=1 Tax=Kineococcus sp. SYSU DK007 TaxID=3383128 RepID=UPI003D7DF3FD